MRGRDHVLSLRAEGLAEAVAWMQQYREFWEQRLAALEAFVLSDLRLGRPADDSDTSGHRHDGDVPNGTAR